MRKLVLVICIAALLAAASVSAMAGDGSKIFLQFKAGWYDGSITMANSTASFGAAPVTATANATLGASSYNMATTDGVSTAWATNEQAGSLNGDYAFRLVVAPGTGATVSDHAGDPHANSVYISVWNLDSWSGTTGFALPMNWSVSVYGRNRESLATWSAAELFRATAPSTTAVGNVGFWYQYSGHYSSWAEAIAADEVFYVTTNWAPIPPPITAPEPGSLLALGTGLIGMAGFALRRRKA